MVQTTLSAQLAKLQAANESVNTSSILSQDTRLLDVLAQEFETGGKNSVNTDENGFAYINGLNSLTSKSMSNRNKRSIDKEDKKHEFKSSLSPIKTIKVQPGVVLKEFKAEKRKSPQPLHHDTY